jgi:hypothetical protein
VRKGGRDRGKEEGKKGGRTLSIQLMDIKFVLIYYTKFGILCCKNNRKLVYSSSFSQL